MSRAGQHQAVQGQARGSGGFDLKTGAVYGAGAWIVGLVITGALAWVEFRELTNRLQQAGELGDLSQLSEAGLSAVDFVGWLFYNAHFVDVGFSIMGQGIWLNFITADVNLTGALMNEFGSSTDVAELETALGMLMSTVPTVVWMLVPVATLVVAGYVVATRTGAWDTSTGAKAGASVVAGYLPLAVGGTFVFTLSIPNNPLSISPELMMAAGLMGIVYPAVFGGVGGALAAQTTNQPAGRAGPAAQPHQAQPASYQQGAQQPQQGGYQGSGQQAGYQQQGGYQQGGYQQSGQQPRQDQQYDQGGRQRGHQPARDQRGQQGQDPPRDRQPEQDEQSSRNREDEG